VYVCTAYCTVYGLGLWVWFLLLIFIFYWPHISGFQPCVGHSTSLFSACFTVTAFTVCMFLSGWWIL